MQQTQIDEFDKSTFTARLRNGASVSHAVYQRGDGPPVVLIQELPGIGQETLRLADRLVASGFSVTMPHLFGPIGRTALLGNLVRVFCMRKEFTLFQANASSPVVDWLKALCQDVRTRSGVDGVGVIGMCLTGNFAMSLMADDSVLAAVASQPAMPVGKSGALHMSPTEVEGARARIDATAPMMALRFAEDPGCNAQKFAAIDATFNDDGVVRVENTVLPGKGHSVLTVDFVDEEGHPTHEALQEVLAYFHAQLD